MKIWKRLRTWRRRRRFEADLAEEIRIHREMSGAAAFGSVALTLEESRAVWGLAWLDSWKQDIRYALRGFRRSPGFALGVIGAIGLGIGLNTTVFTIFNSYVLRPFAVRDPYSLYRFAFNTSDRKGHRFTTAEVEDLARRGTPFVEAAACRGLCRAARRPLLFRTGGLDQVLCDARSRHGRRPPVSFRRRARCPGAEL
jgi:putative ABC transport system permease protein